MRGLRRRSRGSARRAGGAAVRRQRPAHRRRTAAPAARRASRSAARSPSSPDRATTTPSSTTPTTSTTRCALARLRLFGEWRHRAAAVAPRRGADRERRRASQVPRALRPLASVARARPRRAGRPHPAGHRRVRAARVRPRQPRHRLAARLSVPHVAAAGRAAGHGRRSAAHARRAAGGRAIPIGSTDDRPGRAARLGVTVGHRRRGHLAARPTRAGGRRHAGAPAMPVVRETNDGLQWSGRVGVHLPGGLDARRLGRARAHGSIASVLDLHAARTRRAIARRRVVGVDVEVRPRAAGSCAREWLRTPRSSCRSLTDARRPIAVSTARPVSSKRAIGCIRAGRSAARVERLGVRPRHRHARRRLPTSWDAPVDRVEGVLGFRATRHLEVRAGWQHNWRDGGRVRERGYPTAARPRSGSDACAPLRSPRRSSLLRPVRRWPRRRSPRAAARSAAASVVAETRRAAGTAGRRRARRRAVHDPIDRARAASSTSKPAPRQAFGELRAGRARMDQRGEQFVPRVLAITVGTHRRLSEQRHDVSQRLLALARRNRSISAATRRAGPAAVRFDRPGIVPVFCDIHSHMSAYILVFSHPFFAVTDDDGRYAIRGRAGRARTRSSSGASWGAPQPRRVTRRRGRDGRSRLPGRPRAHEPALVAHQPHLPRERARSWWSRSGVAIYRVNDVGGGAGRDAICAAASTKPRRSSTSSAARSSRTSSSRARSSPTCPMLKGAAATDDPPTVAADRARTTRRRSAPTCSSSLGAAATACWRDAGRMRLDADAIVGDRSRPAATSRDGTPFWPFAGGVAARRRDSARMPASSARCIVGFSLDRDAARRSRRSPTATSRSSPAAAIVASTLDADAHDALVDARHADRRVHRAGSAARTTSAACRPLGRGGRAGRAGRRSCCDRGREHLRLSAGAALADRADRPRGRARRDAARLRDRAHRDAAAPRAHGDDARDGGRPATSRAPCRRAAGGTTRTRGCWRRRSGSSRARSIAFSARPRSASACRRSAGSRPSSRTRSATR